MADVRTVSPAVSLAIVEGVHARFGAVLDAMTPEDFARLTAVGMTTGER